MPLIGARSLVFPVIFIADASLAVLLLQRDGGREGGREGGSEGGREGERDGETRT